MLSLLSTAMAHHAFVILAAPGVSASLVQPVYSMPLHMNGNVQVYWKADVPSGRVAPWRESPKASAMHVGMVPRALGAAGVAGVAGAAGVVGVVGVVGAAGVVGVVGAAGGGVAGVKVFVSSGGVSVGVVVSVGVLSVGAGGVRPLLPVGVLSVLSVLSVGVLSVGVLSVGVLSVGVLSVGVVGVKVFVPVGVSVGGVVVVVSVGVLSVGGVLVPGRTGESGVPGMRESVEGGKAELKFWAVALFNRERV
jgi:hypothetical protein